MCSSKFGKPGALERGCGLVNHKVLDVGLEPIGSEIGVSLEWVVVVVSKPNPTGRAQSTQKTPIGAQDPIFFLLDQTNCANTRGKGLFIPRVKCSFWPRFKPSL